VLRKDGDGLSPLFIGLNNIIKMNNLKTAKEQRHFLSDINKMLFVG